MWLVSSDGEWLGGKRLWLRPGTEHLFGRTSGKSLKGEKVHYIANDKVSRKHLTIRIGEIKAGDSSRLFAHSSVTFADSSRSGTVINGSNLMGDSQTLDSTIFRIKLGLSPVRLTLEWHPVLLTFTGVRKGANAKSTALEAARQKLEPMDIKITTEYLTGQTTHVVAKTRNTAPGLQALVEGRWVVANSYVDALAAAGEGDALESDFDGNWAQEKEHICPQGAELDPCPDDWLVPNPERAEVFSGYTFVTLSDSQLSKLMPVITAGGGKAFCCEFTEGETTAQDVIKYVRELAGSKDSRTYLLSEEPTPGGIVVIRPTDSSSSRDQSIVSEIDIALNQRSIKQGELLGAILRADASVLRLSLRDFTQNHADSQREAAEPLQRHTRRQRSASVIDSSPIELPPQSTRGNPPTQQQPEEISGEGHPAPAAKSRRRFITQKQFKGFDDFDDDEPVRGCPQQAPPSHQPSQQPGFDPTNVSQGVQRDNDTQRRSQKRPAPEEEELDETEEQMLDRILPGQAAMKRRRTEAAAKELARAAKPAPRATPTPEEPAATKKVEKAKGKGKAKIDSDADIKAKMAARREAEEEARRKETEAIDITEEDIQKIHAHIERFELPVRPARSATTETGEGRGKKWDPRWNGRQNFKKFRPKGTAIPREESQESQAKVIITLAEMPTRGHGLGDDYWLEHGDARPTETQSQSQSRAANIAANNTSFARGENEDEEHAAFRRRIRKSREQDADDAAGDSMFNPAAASSGTQSTLATDTQRKAAGKRPATMQLSGPAKKARPTTTASSRIAEVSDDEDPRAFKRKRR